MPGIFSGKSRHNGVRSLPAACTLIAPALGLLLVAGHGTASAVDYTWTGGLTGSWGDTSKWSPTGAPSVSGDTADVNGGTGTVVNLLTTGGTPDIGITVRPGNTLLGNGAQGTSSGQRLGSVDTASLLNQGTIENAVIQFGSYTATNTGLIQANGAGSFMTFSNVPVNLSKAV
jgi:hypothetical protein